MGSLFISHRQNKQVWFSRNLSCQWVILDSTCTLSIFPWTLVLKEFSRVAELRAYVAIHTTIWIQNYILSIYGVCMCIVHTAQCVCVEVRRQLAGAGSLLLPFGSWGLKSGYQASWQASTRCAVLFVSTREFLCWDSSIYFPVCSIFDCY